VDWIRRAGPPDPATTYWISFRHDLLDAVKSAFPSQQTLLLVGDENFPYNPNTRHQGYGIAKKLILEPAVLASLSEKGKVWSVWTENDPARAAYWREAGFRFLTTDHPDRFKDR
jgi:glycerophosphoryl diester phosphodiesterase